MEEYDWELGLRVIVDDWIISTQKHSVNFIANHVKKSYFGKKK